MPQPLSAQSADASLWDGIKTVLDRVRPNLRNDGGDVELEGVSASGEVTLRLVGCVARCPMAAIALVAGLESALRDAVPGVTAVRILK
jgi:Fe-S cluster biogenesis protein NfuA